MLTLVTDLRDFFFSDPPGTPADGPGVAAWSSWVGGMAKPGLQKQSPVMDLPPKAHLE